jgi:hypothetical protein
MVTVLSACEHCHLSVLSSAFHFTDQVDESALSLTYKKEVQDTLYRTLLIAADRMDAQKGRDVLELFKNNTPCHGLDGLLGGILAAKEQLQGSV